MSCLAGCTVQSQQRKTRSRNLSHQISGSSAKTRFCCVQQKVLFKSRRVTHLNYVSTHNHHHLVLFSLQTPLFSYTPLSGVSLAGTEDTLSRLHKEHASPLSFYQYFPQKSVKKEIMLRTSPRIIQNVDRNLQDTV